MDSNVVLSICIPTYNRRDAVYDCVTKILNNYHNDDIEVIVSDNCSVDGTREKLSTIQDKRFKYYRNEENTKFINLLIALSYSDGQFSMLLSDEDEVNIRYLPDLLQYLNRNAGVSIVKSTIYDEMTKTKQYSDLANIFSYYDKVTRILDWGYMSGIIYNTQFSLPVLRKLNFKDYEKYWKIIGEYPHIWLALLICHKGRIIPYKNKLVIQFQECKSDNVLDKNRSRDFPWGIHRRYLQTISTVKSFKHLQLSQLDTSEKVGLYCNRVKDLMKATGSIYYSVLYGVDFDLHMRKYHPEDMENLEYWRAQPHYIMKNIYRSYKIVNQFIVGSLWKNKTKFHKDCMKNYRLLGKLYYDTILEYLKCKKCLKKRKVYIYGLKG